MFVVDALVANGDRHAGNFGYLKDGSVAPVYDNGAALFPDVHKYAKECGTSKELLKMFTLELPVSSIQVKQVMPK